MKVAWSERFEEQRRELGFCYTCEDCAYFDSADTSCLHGFPNEMHRAAASDAGARPTHILFCKDFDLA